MRGDTIFCRRCHRRVAQINPSTAEIEWTHGAHLLYPTEGTFRLSDAIVACPQGHHLKLGVRKVTILGSDS